jgi:hypothetical protein
MALDCVPEPDPYFGVQNQDWFTFSFSFANLNKKINHFRSVFLIQSRIRRFLGTTDPEIFARIRILILVFNAQKGNLKLKIIKQSMKVLRLSPIIASKIPRY